MVTFFENADGWWAWLEAHHDSASELIMGINKKHVTPRGLTWEDAVPIALAWGWIDSQSRRISDEAIQQRWTPRKTGSNWSKINVAAAELLIAQGRMQPSGLAAFERRREDRTGIYSFEQDELELSPAQTASIEANPAAAAFWRAATPGYRKICTHWVTSAKQQATNDRRLAQLITDSAAGQLIPTQRYGDKPAWLTRAAQAAADAS